MRLYWIESIKGNRYVAADSLLAALDTFYTVTGTVEKDIQTLKVVESSLIIKYPKL